MEPEREALRLAEERREGLAYLRHARRLPVEGLAAHLHVQGVGATALVARVDDEGGKVLVKVQLGRAELETVGRARVLQQARQGEGEVVKELDVERAQVRRAQAREDALEVRAAAAEGEQAQAGERDARQGRALQSPLDLAVRSGAGEVDRDHLQMGQVGELRDEVLGVQVG